MSVGVLSLAVAAVLSTPAQTDEVSAVQFLKAGNRQFEVDGIQVELQIEVSEKDLEDIRFLAAELGIREIQKIFIGYRGLIVGKLVALVESRAVRDGDKIAQSELKLRQRYWQSSADDSDGDLRTRGLWQAGSTDLRLLDRWIVRDGDWSIEVGLGEVVPYDDVVRVIRAIRAGSLVDARQDGPDGILTPLSQPYELKQWGAKAFPDIKRDTRSGESGRYLISLPKSMGSETILYVRVVGDRVEVLGVFVRDH
jgi:hypothetical protein